MIDPVLKIDGLFKKFGGMTVTNNVGLTLMPGEIHALIGPNGAGKSTLLNQIGGELAPDAGSIMLAGHDITALSADERVRLGLARTFQVTTLLDEFTVLENLGMALQVQNGHNFRIWDNIRRRPLWAEARQRLAEAELEARCDITVADLSHGERKQLELVIALALRPRALLLDEPMAGLGHVESQHMIGVIDSIRHETAILLVEHDMEAVFSLADRISVLVYGQIIATGTASEIRENPKVREAYLGSEDELC